MKHILRTALMACLAVFAVRPHANAQQAVQDKDGFDSVFQIYISNPDPIKATAAEEELKRLAATENPLAQFYYGHLLVRTSEDNSEAAHKLFSISYPKVAELARAGNTTAAYMVTLNYKYGYATPVNSRRAFKMRLQLAEKNYGPAAYAVGLAYLDGDGVKTNGDKAAYWLARAAQAGMSAAAVALADAYMAGQVLKQSWQLAYYWYSVAAVKGDRYAARMREEVKPRLSRRDMLESYRMLIKGDSSHYPAGDYNLGQRSLMALGIILPWLKFMLLDRYIWLDGAAFGLAALLLMGAMTSWRRRRFLTDIPLSNIRDIFIGWVHIKGEIRCLNPLMSYLAERECVYYSWSVTEDWEKTVMEEYIDKDGKKQLREKKERGSKVVDSGGRRVPFDLEDETGSVPVHSGGSEMDTVTSFYRTCGPGDPLYFGMCDKPEIEDTLHVRHFSEAILPVNVDSTIFGHAGADGAGGLAITADDDTPFYVISLTDAAAQKKSWLTAIWAFSIFSLIAVMTFPVARIWFLEDKPGLAGFTLICLLAYGLLFFTFWFWMAFNGVIYLKNRVLQIKALIDVQLKRRADLLPRLAEAARGFGAYEKALVVRVAELRGGGYRPVYNTLTALEEGYPGLGAGEIYLRVMAGIKDAEDKIAGAKSSYLDAATAYNTRLERLPDRLLLRLRLFKPAPVKYFVV